MGIQGRKVWSKASEYVKKNDLSSDPAESEIVDCDGRDEQKWFFGKIDQ